MSGSNWTKVENEHGYPVYVLDKATGKEQFDHPEFIKILDSLNVYDDIRYSVYRTAFKLFALQKQIKVPPLRIISGVFARHQLSLSENSLSLDPDEIEAVLADIYFAAEKEGLFSGNVDLTVDLMINLVLNIYDRDRKIPVRVLAAKAVLIILSEESAAEKWLALSNCAADHNGCVSPRRLANLLTHVSALSTYLGGRDADDIQQDVDACFDKSAGMLGVTAQSVAEWASSFCSTGSWINVLSRILKSRTHATVNTTCRACTKPLVQVLRFKCFKCRDLFFCEKCYLFDIGIASIEGHKKHHTVQEIVDTQTKSAECRSFIEGVRKFLFCTKKKKKKSKQHHEKENVCERDTNTGRKRPAMFTSTVGKASGHNAKDPSTMLNDIIGQLENQNKALQDLTEQLKYGANDDSELKLKMDVHRNQISTQINRLKMLKENLSISPQSPPNDQTQTKDKDRMQAFDLFSPIPVLEEEKQSKIPELKTQPRVLSLDSGNFSVASKQTDNNNMMAVSGEELKPVVQGNSDTISAVSMNDISSWYNETDTNRAAEYNRAISASHHKFESDLRSVARTNNKMKELNADLDTVLDRLQQILTNNFAMDDSCFDNTQLRETANEMEGLLGTLIRGVEERATLTANKGLV